MELHGQFVQWRWRIIADQIQGTGNTKINEIRSMNVFVEALLMVFITICIVVLLIPTTTSETYPVNLVESSSSWGASGNDAGLLI